MIRTCALALLAVSSSAVATPAIVNSTGDPTEAALRRCLDAPAAASTAGQTECEGAAARRYDQRMNAAYAGLMRRLPSTAAARLRLAQRAWLTFRTADEAARSALYETRQGTMYVPMQAAASTNIVRDRAIQLEDALRVMSIDECDNSAMTGTTNTVLGTVTMLLLQPVLLGLTIYIVYRLVKRRSTPAAVGPIPTSMEVGPGVGWVVPVIAAFAGVKGLPWWFAIASNNANPSLSVFSSGIRYRMIRKHERRFDQIERIEVWTTWTTVNIEMHFRGELLTFAVNVGTLVTAQAALALFPATIAMSDRAKSVLAGSTS